MPYRNDKERCEDHIRALTRDITRIRREALKLPKLVAERESWKARKLENRNSMGQKVKRG